MAQLTIGFRLRVEKEGQVFTVDGIEGRNNLSEPFTDRADAEKWAGYLRTVKGVELVNVYLETTQD